MFGYVRPYKPELKVRDYESFRAMYCGLCHTLRRRYGLGSRMLLSYDMCFAAHLMSGVMQCGSKTCRKRCIVSPFRKRDCIRENMALDLAADCSVILSWWKLRDSVRDERGLKKLFARVGSRLMRRKYRRAAAARPDFAAAAEQGITRLNELEDAKTASLDRPADAFASIAEHMASGLEDERVRRPAEQILYHIGRWVYITDAWDDLEEDEKNGSYNAIAARFDLTAPGGREEAKEAVRLTLLHSAETAAAAAELLDLGRCGPVVSNVLYMGLPAMGNSVLEGTMKKRSARHGSI